MLAEAAIGRAPRGAAKRAAMPIDPISSANAAVAQITGAIRQAARAVGTSFAYLLATAKVESNFNPHAKATTSSAAGLFQFIEQTWLATMKEAGPRLGYSRYADAIIRQPNGRYEVADPAARATILNLRHEPAINAAMAGAFTRKNAEILQARLGRAPTEGELYIAHFLGAGGAARLIKAAARSPASGAELFPNAARANRSVFYDKQGRARSAAEVYATLTGRYDIARASSTPSRILATASARAPSRASDPSAMTRTFAAAEPLSLRPADTGPVFHALFHTGDRPGPLGPKIHELWAPHAPSQERIAALPEASAPSGATGRPLDLFQDLPPRARGIFTGQG